jgi:hypothetical protein
MAMSALSVALSEGRSPDGESNTALSPVGRTRPVRRCTSRAALRVEVRR